MEEGEGTSTEKFGTFHTNLFNDVMTFFSPPLISFSSKTKVYYGKRMAFSSLFCGF